jgi:hypothetical protein
MVEHVGAVCVRRPEKQLIANQACLAVEDRLSRHAYGSHLAVGWCLSGYRAGVAGRFCARVAVRVPHVISWAGSEGRLNAGGPVTGRRNVSSRAGQRTARAFSVLLRRELLVSGLVHARAAYTRRSIDVQDSSLVGATRSYWCRHMRRQ